MKTAGAVPDLQKLLVKLKFSSEDNWFLRSDSLSRNGGRTRMKNLHDCLASLSSQARLCLLNMLVSSVYNFDFKGLMEPTCLKIIYIRVCVFDTCGFHHNIIFILMVWWNRTWLKKLYSLRVCVWIQSCGFHFVNFLIFMIISPPHFRPWGAAFFMFSPTV